MLSFKLFLESIPNSDSMYVIGHRKTYDKNIEQARQNREAGHSKMPAMKVGLKRNPSVEYDHGIKHEPVHKDETGVAFHSPEAAKEAINKHWPEKRTKGSFPARKEMSVYKVKGSFGPHSVYHNKNTGFHHLKHDAEIEHRID